MIISANTLALIKMVAGLVQNVPCGLMQKLMIDRLLNSSNSKAKLNETRKVSMCLSYNEHESSFVITNSKIVASLFLQFLCFSLASVLNFWCYL